MNETSLILNRFKQTFEKAKRHGPSLSEGAWHGPSLIEALEHVDLSQAKARPIEARHTIWEIANHCSFWVEAVNRTLRGEDMVNIEATEDWPGTGETADEWRRDLAGLRKAYDDLAVSIKNLNDSQLEKTTGSYFGGRYFSFTYRKMLHGISDHNTYHAGQISILKRK